MKGNLFCLHLSKEGIIIYDNNNLLRNIIDGFKYKDSYSEEIQEASDLGWVLTEFFKTFDNYFYFNKKLAWCIRTIIIAKAAQLHEPIFAKNDLMNFVNDQYVSNIIGAKSNENYIAENIGIMKILLEKHGKQKPE